MAIDAFLQFTEAGLAIPIKGETQDALFGKKKDPPCFEIQQWSFGLANQSTIGSATMGAGSGKASFEPFKVTKNVDRATAYMFQTCCAGGHYKLLTLWVRKTGSQTDASGDWYLQWQFKMAFVSNIAWANNDPQPTEEVTFIYGAIKFDYREQKPDGSFVEGDRNATWSQVQNSEEFEVPGI